ncbi:hypothetical protein [Paenibacillus sp. FSL M7-0420]|uniref:hypothetical protein n=1 Tax=Paenibacillus sp. FSL M7-0420 TaxID=2921609 RepID=UPI0030F6D96F
MRVTFEEKTYENYFNLELGQRSDIYFPLGQVQEGDLGFDASAYSIDTKMWSIMGCSSSDYSGSRLRNIAEIMEKYLNKKINDLPKMKANILFQYKRPEYFTNSRASEWHYWNTPYYRYNIYKEQQELLMEIHNNLGSKVLAIYASPALHKVDELVDRYIKKQIIKYSNFKRVVDLNNHHRNTYTKSGNYSIACSEPEYIENHDINQLIDELDDDNLEDQENRDFVIKFRKGIEIITLENKIYSEAFSLLNEKYRHLKEYELLYSFFVMRNFRQLTGSQWLVKMEFGKRWNEYEEHNYYLYWLLNRQEEAL